MNNKIPVLEVSDKVTYRGEGNLNIVLKDDDNDQILRMRKVCVSNEPYWDEIQIESTKIMIKLISMLINCDYCMQVKTRYMDLETINKINSKIEHLRPEYRKEKRLNPNCSVILVTEDACSLPKVLRNRISLEFPNASVEIKPKFGALPLKENYNNEIEILCSKKCIFSMMQYHPDKCQKWSNSLYCPCDLFSQQPDRMKKAFNSMLDSPQNNINFFFNQKTTSISDFFNEILSKLNLSRNEFIDLIIASLLVKTYDATMDILQDNPIMKEIFLIDTKWSSQCLCSNTKDEKLTDICSDNPTKFSNILAQILKLQCLSSESMQSLDRDWRQFLIWIENYNRPKSAANVDSKMNYFLSKIMEGEDVWTGIECRLKCSIIKVLRHLIAMTMRDCSLIISLNKTEEFDKLPNEHLKRNIHIIDIQKGENSQKESFIVQITIVDLDPKWRKKFQDRVKKEREMFDGFTTKRDFNYDTSCKYSGD